MPGPLEFNEAIADAICVRLVDGESLRSICRNDEMPAKSTVFEWLGLITAFADQYARAGETRADRLANISSISQTTRRWSPATSGPHRRAEMAGREAAPSGLRGQGRCRGRRQDRRPDPPFPFLRHERS